MEQLEEAVKANDVETIKSIVTAAISANEGWDEDKLHDIIINYVRVKGDKKAVLTMLLELWIKPVDDFVMAAIDNEDIETINLLNGRGVNDYEQMAGACLTKLNITLDSYSDQRVTKRRLALIKIAMIGDHELFKKFYKEHTTVFDLFLYAAILGRNLDIAELVMNDCTAATLHYAAHYAIKVGCMEYFVRFDIPCDDKLLVAAIKTKQIPVYNTIVKLVKIENLESIITTAVESDFIYALNNLRPAFCELEEYKRNAIAQRMIKMAEKNIRIKLFFIEWC